jgi:hypothetical protein
MPAATHYWSATAADRDLATAAESERRLRAEIYRRACDQYDGNHKKFLKHRENAVDPNVIINLNGEGIDQIIAFACPSMPTIEISESEQTPLESWIADVWQANEGATLLQDALLYGCLTGHIYARILPPSANNPLPQVVMLNPGRMITYWRAEDVRDVLWHELSYSTDRRYRIDFINGRAFNKSGWEIRTSVMEGNAWKLLRTEAWPYPFGPIVDWQHQRDPRHYYGKSHLLASNLNDSVNKVASDIKQILRYHAAPRTIGKGVAAKDVETTSIDSFFTIPKEADVFNLEMQSDLVSSLRFYEMLREAHAAEMRVVRVGGGLDTYKGITNFGLRIAFMAMLAQNEQLHRNYDKGILAITRRLLMLANQPADVRLRVHWPRPLPYSELEESQTVEVQQRLGLLSKQTAAARLGLDYTTEQTRITAEVPDAETSS